MQANSSQAQLSDDRRKEYQRQQEKLKAMAATSEKNPTVSADVMIENLLKNSFKKAPEISPSVQQLEYSYGEIPLWLQHNSAAVPAQYRHLWSLVQSTVDLADTQKVSQLLLTSGLQVDILGFIWNLTNKAVPGQLTKQEFYIILALVSLVQTGYAFNNLDILKLLKIPVIPVLQLGLLKFPVPQPDSVEKVETSNYNVLKDIQSLSLQSNLLLGSSESEKENNCSINNGIIKTTFSSDKKNTDLLEESYLINSVPANNYSNSLKQNSMEPTNDFHKNSNFPCIGSSPTAELEDDFSAFQSVSTETDNSCKKVSQSVHDLGDEFSEFQSANIEHVDPFETVVINQKREIPKIPLPKTLTGKFTGAKSSILKISPESGKKLKVLAASESLSSLPESKISSSNKVSTSVSVLGSNHGIGSRLANQSLSTKLDKSKCHKHHKIKINPTSPAYLNTEPEVILGVKTKNLETVIPKCHPKTSSTYTSFLLKETKIGSDEVAESSHNELQGIELEPSGKHSGEQTRQIQIPMLGTFNETVLPTQSKVVAPNVDLISVQEDRYSALREIELELNKEKDYEAKELGDDFGDFLSADVSVLNTPKSSQSAVETYDLNSQLVSLQNEDKDSWGDWNFNTETSLNSSLNLTNMAAPPAPLLSDSKTLDEAPPYKAEDSLFEQFDSLTVSDECKKEPQPYSFLSNQLDFFGEDTKVGGASDEVIFEEQTEKAISLAAEFKTDQTESNQLPTEFWGFLGSEAKPQSENIFGKLDSPPNLDLNTPSSNDSDQEIIWRKCIDSCLSLIQEGHDIFNNIVTKSVLDEVFAAPETETYLNNLNIVCQISKRISQNFTTYSASQNELERLWGKLQDLCFEYNIKLKLDQDNFSEGKLRCSICLGLVGQDPINEGSHGYHPSCANLWINYVEKNLPTTV